MKKGYSHPSGLQCFKAEMIEPQSVLVPRYILRYMTKEPRVIDSLESIRLWKHSVTRLEIATLRKRTVIVRSVTIQKRLCF